MINVRQNSLHPYVQEYIQDFPDVSVPPDPSDLEPQESFEATLDELENVISDLFLTLRGMRSHNYDF